jgi:hypothetical protein
LCDKEFELEVGSTKRKRRMKKAKLIGIIVGALGALAVLSRRR